MMQQHSRGQWARLTVSNTGKARVWVAQIITRHFRWWHVLQHTCLLEPLAEVKHQDHDPLYIACIHYEGSVQIKHVAFERLGNSRTYPRFVLLIQPGLCTAFQHAFGPFLCSRSLRCAEMRQAKVTGTGQPSQASHESNLIDFNTG